jgi:hypothetical protein
MLPNVRLQATCLSGLKHDKLLKTDCRQAQSLTFTLEPHTR